MRKLFALAVACLVAPVVTGETSITGKWATPKKAQPSMVMEFNAVGPILTGTIHANDNAEIVMPILDGKIVGDNITFKTTVPDSDGAYTMMFSGRRTGNTITFKCDVEVNPPGEKVALGPACVQSVTVKRTSR
jgi:hypothetical protein